MHSAWKDKKLQASRYTSFEKDICAYQFLTAGRGNYAFLASNSSTISIKTIQRHLKQNTVQITEGKIDAKGLKQYLLRNEFPLAVVVLCEDATKIAAALEYDYISDSVRGLVSPLDEHGLPNTDLFTATSAYKMAEDIEKYPVGNHAYVQLALPLANNASPYVLFHTCSDNKFEAKDVLNRWKHTEYLLEREGIKVMAHASDGDPRLLKAMKIRAGYGSSDTPSRWGDWFRIRESLTTPINVQDMIHTVNKFRNRLINSDMQFGIVLFVYVVLKL